MNVSGSKVEEGSAGCCEGLELGTVSAKWVQLGPNGQRRALTIRHEGDPKEKLREILERHSGTDSRIVVTGQAARMLLDLPYRPETECLEKGLADLDVEPDILLSLGGETFVVYTLKHGRIRNLFATSKCAAGTGEFISQQFHRMGLTLEDGIREARAGNLVELATRCSVHCKSDATHKLNKGQCRPADIARSLVNDLARKVCKMVELAQWPARLVVVAGGVSRNDLFVQALAEHLPGSDIRILEESPYLEAYGAALLAAESARPPVPARRNGTPLKESANSLEVLRPLEGAHALLDYRVLSHEPKRVAPGASYILGVDAGSTTTKAALLRVDTGSVDASCYLRTHGNPIEATRNCLREIRSQAGDTSIEIVQVAATGSGREMVSVFLDNSLSFNEILSHARAASEEVPGVDTVFEIGGQDSKYISFLDGIPIDYAMNEGCSAGTGSFLEESVSTDMGIPVEAISSRAESSGAPIAFGERCAAFINSDLRNAIQLGARQRDVIAGLVQSIADNYISRVVGVRPIGETLLFQGGVALNRSVALAIATRTRRRVVVPKHPELMGAVGCALMARDLVRDGDAARLDCKLDDLLGGSMEPMGTFRCAACENRCEVRKISVGSKVYPFGGLCSKFELQRRGKHESKDVLDLVAVANEIMFERFRPEDPAKPRGTIGVPMALTSYAFFPFYAALVRELGFRLVLADPSKAGNAKTGAPICYPCEVVHGHSHDLLSKGVDFILLPNVIEGTPSNGSPYGFTCPSTAIIPGLVGSALGIPPEKLLAPDIGFSAPLAEATILGIERLAPLLGLPPGRGASAARAALVRQADYDRALAERARASLPRLTAGPTIILTGRPYVVRSPELNLALPRKITSRGYHVVSADMLPRPHPGIGESPNNVWHFTQQTTNAVRYAQRHPDMYVCLVSCFSCIPDAVLYHLARQELAGRVFCYLEIDSHTAHAGFETRVGAFLDIVEEGRRGRR